MKKRRFAIVAALIVAALFAQLSVIGQDDSIQVFDWAGYDLDGFWAPFAAANPDIDVEFTYITEDSEAFARVASGLEADVMHPCWHQPYVTEGLVQPLDTSRLTAWEAIPDVLKAKGMGEDGEQYFVPHVWGYSSIIVRSDLVPTMPTSWADLWNPEYAGKIGIFDSGEEAFVSTALALGLDPFNTTVEEQAQIEQKLIDLKPNLLSFLVDPAEMEQLLINGDIWIMAGGWNSTYLAVQRALDEQGSGGTVEYLDPAEGRIGWLCGYGIPTSADNLDLAYEYINALTSAESQAYLTNTFGFGGANPESLEMVDEATVTALQLNDTDILNDTVFLRDVTPEMREIYATIWDNVKLS